MHRVFVKMYPLSVMKLDRSEKIWNRKLIKYVLAPVMFSSSIYYYQNKELPVFQEDDKQEYEMPKQPEPSQLMKYVQYILRFIQLTIIFTPTIILLPLCVLKATRKYWVNTFLTAIKTAGIVWIKAFQYLSHRRDIIGEEMAKKFSILRQNSPQHEYQQTQQIISRVYGKNIHEIFEQFETKPVASGSVSQVYKAKMKGKTVAVKVRHPNIGKNLQKDIDILFFVSKCLSIFSKKFQIPVTDSSLKKILSQQLCFLRQKDNLDKFNTMVVDKDIKFPRTYSQSTNQVLIEEFIDGKTIGFYENNTHNLNRLIANIGAKAFFSMLMKYNFVHADCHAGNILVRFTDAPNEVTNYFYGLKNKLKNLLISQIIKFGFDSQFLKKLSKQNYQYDQGVQDLIKIYKQRVQIILIDVGMAIRLTKQKKQSFQQFLKEVIQGDPLKCAQWIFRISKYDGISLVEGENKNYMKDLIDMFSNVHKTTLQSLEGIYVLNEMLRVIRDHNMKIDGQISILLTNMLVLEAIAKDLDPNINILRCAVPYLQYQ